MANKLPDVNELYSTFFDRWYGEEDRKRKGFEFARPDMMKCYRAGLMTSKISCLTEEFQGEAIARVQRMVGSAKTDWARYLAVNGEIDEQWVLAADKHYDRKAIRQLIKISDPSDFSNDLVVTVCQFGAVLGEVLRQIKPRLLWLPEWPYWETSLYDPISGNVIPTFHWAMKKFSSYGVDDGFVEKLHCCVHILDNPDG
jgi:hypothetical protein